jgi:tRNA U34 5-carboxymethylaminomethyl modifying GTPase MnmE/TrmE
MKNMHKIFLVLCLTGVSASVFGMEKNVTLEVIGKKVPKRDKNITSGKERMQKLNKDLLRALIERKYRLERRFNHPDVKKDKDYQKEIEKEIEKNNKNIIVLLEEMKTAKPIKKGKKLIRNVSISFL